MSVVMTKSSQRALLPLSASYRLLALLLLVLVGICAWMDRQVIGIVLQSIRQEFALSDTQLGLIGGTAFGLFYVTVGLPIAWLADRYNRRNIVAAATGLWSLATLATSFASGFLSLFLCRMAVGIGEAGAAAPSQSLVSDYFSPRHRALAMGALYTYIPIGYLLSFSLGGTLNDSVGWRNAFMLFAAPGLILAVIVRLALKEPVRGGTGAAVATPPPQLSAAIRYFLSRGSLRHLPIAGAIHGLGMTAMAIWIPSYFMRTYHMTASAVGMRLALIMGIAGFAGTVGGGHLVDRLVSRSGDARWYGRACAIFLICTVPFTLVVFTTGNADLAFLLFIVPAFLNHMILGPVFAAVQNLAGVRRRAMAAAYYLFLVNLVSAGLGPLLVGGLSDLMRAPFGEASLRISLLLVVPLTSAWGAVHMYLASRSMAADLLQAAD